MAFSNQVVLGLGSNLGDSRLTIISASRALSSKIHEIRLSPFYFTEPMYVKDQAQYLNAALVGNFSGSPDDLLRYTQSIETQFGRDRKQELRWGSRTLDIDLLLFSDLLIDLPPRLQIPHPRLAERKFALLPLLNLLPEALDPRSGRYFWQLYAELEDQGIYYADLAPYNHSAMYS